MSIRIHLAAVLAAALALSMQTPAPTVTVKVKPGDTLDELRRLIRAAAQLTDEVW